MHYKRPKHTQKKTTKNSKISSARTITRTECRSNVTEAKIALVQTKLSEKW